MSRAHWAASVDFPKPAGAVISVTRAMPEIFGDSRIAIDESNKLYRARVTGLTKADAEKACAKLKAQRSDCLVFITDDGLAKAN